ncbi:MAG: oligosaccharide flippase family protein [Rubrobacter sp.]
MNRTVAETVQRISHFVSRDRHTREVAGGAAVALVLRFAAAGLSFVFNIVLARLLGIEGVGVYFLAFTVTTLAAVAGRAGMDNALLRFVATSAAQANWAEVSGLYRRAIWISTGASAAITALVFIAAPVISEDLFSDPDLIDPLRLMSLGIVPFSLLTLHGELLKGLKRIRDAMLVQAFCLQLFAIPLLLLLGVQFGLLGATAAYVTTLFLVLILSVVLWRRATPQIRGLRGHFDTRLLVASSLPLFWATSGDLAMNWTDTLMLGILSDSEAVGIYGVAMRTALPIGFIVIAVTSAIAPRFAVLYAHGEVRALESLARKATGMMILLVSPVLLLLVAFPEWVLGFFGAGFRSGAPVLAILAAGQFTNVAFSLADTALMMSGYVKVVRNNVLLGALLNVLLNVLLIPAYGPVGAAVATATATAVRRLAAVYLMRKYLSVKLWFL